MPDSVTTRKPTDEEVDQMVAEWAAEQWKGMTYDEYIDEIVRGMEEEDRNGVESIPGEEVFARLLRGHGAV